MKNYYFFIFVLILAGLQVVVVRCTYFDEQTQFHIEWPGGKVKKPSRTEDRIVLATRNNENYVCYMPKDKEESDVTDLRDPFIPVPNEIELLKPLFDKDVCVSKVTSYWTYELCHGKNLRQFHKEESIVKVTSSNIISDSSVNQYLLGKYREPDWRNHKQLQERYKASDKPPTYRFSRVELPYFPVDLDPGDRCDLTQQPRTARVLYFCQPDTKAELYDIQEVSTCSYELLVFTSYLCDNKKYRATIASKEIGIKCYPGDETSPKKPADLGKLRPSPPRYRDIFGSKKPASKDDKDEDEDEYVDDFWVMDQFGLGPAPDLDADEPFSIFGRKEEKKKVRKAMEDVGGKEGNYEFLVKTPSKPLVTDYQTVKDFLRGTYCLRGGMPGGWWRYELCFGQWARQFHEEVGDDKRTTSRTDISLGNWQADKHIKWLMSNPSKRPKKQIDQRKSIAYLYGGGDVCDATGLPRHTVVKLTCNPSDMSEAIGISLSEPSTCIYEIDVIAGNWLCTVVRMADDDGIFDLETVIAALPGAEPSSPPPPAPTPAQSAVPTTTTPKPQIVEPTPTPTTTVTTTAAPPTNKKPLPSSSEAKEGKKSSPPKK